MGIELSLFSNSDSFLFFFPSCLCLYCCLASHCLPYRLWQSFHPLNTPLFSSSPSSYAPMTDTYAYALAIASLKGVGSLLTIRLNSKSIHHFKTSMFQADLNIQTKVPFIPKYKLLSSDKLIFLLIFHAAAAAAAKSLQSCPTLCNPIDGSPPGSPVPGILQARILEWVAISFSNA